MNQVVRDEAFYAALPKVRYGATALLRNFEDEVLLVKSTGRGDPWSLPGGHAAHDETPPECCERKVLQELGINVDVGRLLVVHWMPPMPPKPYGLQFSFDCGRLDTAAADAKITLPAGVIDDWRFASRADAEKLLSPMLARRIAKAYEVWEAQGIGRMLPLGELWER